MSNSNNNQINIPQAREAMDRFKMQAAQEVGVNLTNGYNGHLTSREAGSVGGQMVKNVCPGRTKKYEREIRIAMGHMQTVQYIATITIQQKYTQPAFLRKFGNIRTCNRPSAMVAGCFYDQTIQNTHHPDDGMLLAIPCDSS